jgi:hypothetical protein
MGRTNEKQGKLMTELKEYVVQRLAAYDSAGAIMRSLREEFGITMTRASNQDCSMLVMERKVEPRGAGGAGDPYRYGPITC